MVAPGSAVDPDVTHTAGWLSPNKKNIFKEELEESDKYVLNYKTK